MTAMRHDIELLQRLTALIEKLLRGVDVLDADRSLAMIAEDIAEARQAARGYRLVGDEAAILARAGLRMVWARHDRDEPRADRWARIALLLNAEVANDVVAALKSEATQNG